MWQPVSVTHVRVGVNMGDHAQDVETAIAVADDTTISELVNAALFRKEWRPGGTDPTPQYDDYIVIRLARPLPPRETPSPDAAE